MLLTPNAKQQNVQLIFWCRLFYFIALIIIIGSFYFESFTDLEESLFLSVVITSLLLFSLQWFLQHRIELTFQFYLPFLMDMLFIAIFVFITGGLNSPFVFAFGLVIVVAGSQPSTLFIMITTLAACIFYICSAYLYAWQWDSQLFVEDTLSMLLQTSALLLVGGIMSTLAKRQIRLEQTTHVVVSKHRNLQEQHRQLIESMQEGVLVLDEKLRIQDSNQAALDFLGYKNNIQTRQLRKLISIPTTLQQFFNKSHDNKFQCEWPLNDRNCLLNVVRLPNENEAMWLLTMVDVSKIRQLEQHIAQQDKLATLGRMASMLAHEIRNPLQTISQAAEIMQPATSAQDQEMRNIMQEEIERLKRLVSDILGYVQPFQPKPSMVNMCELITANIKKIELQNKSDIQYQCKVKEVYLDKDHLRLVLDNLIHNAIRVSPQKKSIYIKVYQKKDQWILTIRDKGSGIPQNIQDHLFEPFVSQSDIGIGLGLATVWQICQANHWHIHFKTSEKGTCFTLEGIMEGYHG